MADWKTVLTENDEVLGEFAINRGTFQGDSLSLFTFLIPTIPLSSLLRRENLGCFFGDDGLLVNHLFFMGCWPFRAAVHGRSNAVQSDGVKGSFGGGGESWRRDIGMEFGLNKCAVLEMKRGERVECEVIKEVDEDG